MRKLRNLTVLASLILAALSVFAGPTFAGEPGTWYKGNLHTHTLWSDGDHYPEMVVDWYKSHGYHFLSLTDHNVLSQGKRWRDRAKTRGGEKAWQQYVKRFGKDHPQTREDGGKTLVRYRNYPELCKQFNEPGRFCLIQGEEITDSCAGIPVHLNAINLATLVPVRQKSKLPIAETIKKHNKTVAEQSKKVGRPMLCILNHPNWRRSLTAEDILAAPCNKFFELYNGGPDCRNFGDKHQAGLEKVWDIVLSFRLSKGESTPLYGVGTDDMHNLSEISQFKAIPGRAWVEVRSKELAPDAIVTAMQAGDFIVSTGVSVKDIRFDGKKLCIDIDAEDGVSYTTRFVGTCEGFDTSSKVAFEDTNKKHRYTRKYSDDIGRVLAEVEGVSPSYTLKGDELYVRAKIISTKIKKWPHTGGETEMAWTQPFIPGRKLKVAGR